MYCNCLEVLSFTNLGLFYVKHLKCYKIMFFEDPVEQIMKVKRLQKR